MIIGVLIPAVLVAVKWIVLRLTHVYAAILDVADSLCMHAGAAAAVAYAREVYAVEVDGVGEAAVDPNDVDKCGARH